LWYRYILIILQKGDTALHISLRARSKRITELLLRNPRNSRLLYRPNKSGETPYSIDAYHQKGILTQIHGHSEWLFLLSCPLIVRLLYLIFSPPKPKAQDELLVSKGDAPASIVRRHASTTVFFSETTKQIYFKFGL
jgi:ankyrin repeat protein